MDTTENQINQWINLLTGSVPEKKVQSMIFNEIAHLDSFLKTDLHTEQRVVDILGRRLSGNINQQSWQVMHDSLSQYFTEDLAYLLYWVAKVEDPADNRLKEVEKYKPSTQVMAFLRAVVGIYGPELTQAFTLLNFHPNNWRSINREIYIDLATDEPHFIIRIQKYNGEEMVIEGPPDSILDLATQIVYTVRLINDRKVFSQPVIDEFLTESSEFIKILTPKKRKKRS